MTVKQSGHESAGQTARDARDHPALDGLARAGMFAYGVVYVLVGWLAAHLALGDRSGKPSGEGALHEVAQQPMGAVALWLAVGGFAALTVWEACQVVGGHRSDDGWKRWGARAASAGRGIVFATLAVLAVRTVYGDSGGSGGPTWTAQLMSLPMGQVLVVAAGLVVVGLGVFSIYRAVTDRWRKDLEIGGRTGKVGGVVAVLARSGYVSRGVAFLVIGGLLAWAGVTHDRSESGGLDQAIIRFRDEPFGPWVMVVVAIGLSCYGAYHLFRGWYLRGS